MLEEFCNLSNSDPKIMKTAELKLIQDVVENKGDIESVMVSPRAGSFTALTNLLNQGKVNPSELFDLMEKCLIPSKESNERERTLICFARILCIGSIFKSTPSITLELAKGTSFIPAALTELVELSQNKSTYFILSVTFLRTPLRENNMSQDAFDNLVWPSISVLFGPENNSKLGKKETKKAARDGDDKDESIDDYDEAENDNETEDDVFRGNWNWVKLCFQIQLALDCKMMGYKTDFECLEDPGKIANALLASNLQFEESFLQLFFKHLAVASDAEQIKSFWKNLVNGIKPNHFEFLCSSVKMSILAGLPISVILSTKLVGLLLSVYKLGNRADLHKKSRETIGSLLRWGKYRKDNEADGREIISHSQSLSKMERKTMLEILFDADEPPSILHEHKFLHPIIRPFIHGLTSQELEHLQGIIMTKLFDRDGKSKLVSRMSIIYLQILGQVPQCHVASPELKLKIARKLLDVAFGREEVSFPSKDGVNQPESTPGIREQTKICSKDALRLILSSNYSFEFISSLSNYISQNLAGFTSNPKTLKIFGDVMKVAKKYTGDHPHLDCILRSYGIRYLLDEEQPGSPAGENVQKVMELVKECDDGDFTELWKFITGSVVRERYPPFNYVCLFNQLLVEGKVKVMFVEGSHMELERKDGEGDEDNDEWDGQGKEIKMEVDKDEDYEEDLDDASYDEEGSTAPPNRMAKLDPAPIANLKAEMVAALDSEKSKELETATEEDLEQMNPALANVLVVKKGMKNGNRPKRRKSKAAYQCPTCPKKFKQRLHLEWHLNFHTGSKPYICKSCGKGFTQPTSLKTHYFRTFHI